MKTEEEPRWEYGGGTKTRRKNVFSLITMELRLLSPILFFQSVHSITASKAIYAVTTVTRRDSIGRSFKVDGRRPEAGR